ncbi:MAG: hypothetical protein GKC07_08680, partial [Methanomicrobiales archaeon]|nr:hypothetical protein [Methanomicrobiales archaeon]
LKNRTLRDWYDCERDATATISEGESLLEMARRTEENRKKADHLEKEESVLFGRRKKFSLELDMMQRQIREVDGTIAVLEETCRHLDRIRDLDEERKRLEDGRPCPLCGSPHHPYANGRIPEMNSQEQDLAGWKNKRSELADASISLGKTVVRTEAEIAENRRKQEDLRHEQESLGKTIATGLSRLDLGPDTPDLSPRIELIIGASRQAAEEARLVISAAENQADLIRDHESLLQSVRNDLEQIHRDMAESGAAVGEHESTITRLRTSLEHEESDMERDRSALKEKLSPYSLELTEDRDMEEILNELTDRCKTYRSLVTAREKTAPLVTSSRARLDHLRHQIGNVADRIEERDAAIRTQVDDLTRKVTGCGFADYQAFLDARIGQGQFEELESLEMEIQNDEIRISALIRSKTDELVKVRDGIEPGVSLGELEESRARLQKELEEVRERLTAIRVVLGQHEEHSRHRNEQLALMDQQRIEADRWERLDQLIGSHDGKKFRTFAQGITFDHLIRNANRHLKNLNNRYILVRTDDGHLDMNVVDMYQAGEVRSTKNLSGGETFIVSLALALGLSDMASNNVRVDSLFLDEGFGTLDSESLDVAIEALIRLQTEGKLIGVISHVPAVKERIPTQIIVEKKAGGISSLSAPGCSFKAG